MKKISALLTRIERIFACNWLNIPYTLYFNFRSMPFKQAIKCPVYIYGFPRFYNLSGKVICPGKIKKGMVRINIQNCFYAGPENGSGQTEICNQGTIIFRGEARFGCGSKFVVSPNATIDFGAHVWCNHNCLFNCFKKITIGEKTRMAHRVQIMDTNFHYNANLTTRKVSNYLGTIEIAEKCWLANSCTIMKGTKLSKQTIIASHSLVNKDFSHLDAGSFIGGMPAKFITNNIFRIRNIELEQDIIQFFNTNPNAQHFDLPDWVTIDNI